jgi:membrane dipeptidase
MDGDRLAAVFHIEGAEAIDSGLDTLEVLYAAGLRSLGIVWSRPNAFGHGVPFRFPSSPDIGPGLTDAGRALVKACNRLGILIDLSHLNEKGFRDVAALSDAPLVATHSNVHALSPHARNLTSWQLGAIRETGGIVGLNFAPGFLRDDGRMTSATDLEVMLRHVDALVEALGEDGVGLGSDFDGAVVPAAIGDAAGLPVLLDALLSRGYGRELVEKIAWKNWLSMLERTIG